MLSLEFLVIVMDMEVRSAEGRRRGEGRHEVEGRGRVTGFSPLRCEYS